MKNKFRCIEHNKEVFINFDLTGIIHAGTKEDCDSSAVKNFQFTQTREEYIEKSKELIIPLRYAAGTWDVSHMPPEHRKYCKKFIEECGLDQ
jgi:hypothetical protein